MVIYFTGFVVQLLHFQGSNWKTTAMHDFNSGWRLGKLFYKLRKANTNLSSILFFSSKIGFCRCKMPQTNEAINCSRHSNQAPYFLELFQIWFMWMPYMWIGSILGEGYPAPHFWGVIMVRVGIGEGVQSYQEGWMAVEGDIFLLNF
jgi:hypothetical protein